MNQKIQQRRRVIKLVASGFGLCALPMVAMTNTAAGAKAAAGKIESRLYTWHGVALGAEVSLQLYHHDGDRAARILAQSVKIISQMENLFSLYQPDSTICQLNNRGVLHNPPAEFADLLSISQDLSHVTGGAFDITVQPLWRHYQGAFSIGSSNQDAQEKGIKIARDLVDYRKLHVSQDKIYFDHGQMAVTLNGIAQGYATDRVSDYLKAEGMTAVLVDIGEYRALGPQADASPWRIGLADPQQNGAISDILDITEGAVATSSGLGDIFDAKGEFHHLLDPHSGKSPHRYLSVTVTSPLATTADGLSTAFFAMSKEEISRCLKNHPTTEVRLTDGSGTVIMRANS